MKHRQYRDGGANGLSLYEAGVCGKQHPSAASRLQLPYLSTESTQKFGNALIVTSLKSGQLRKGLPSPDLEDEEPSLGVNNLIP